MTLDEILATHGDKWELSSSQFEAHAGFGGPIEELAKVSDSVFATQVALVRWQNTNFNPPSDAELALGVCEEAGEYTRAEKLDDTKDAQGDMAIYLGQLLMLNRISISPLLIKEDAPYSAKMSTKQQSAVGWLAHIALKRTQRIRGYGDSIYYRRRLVAVAAAICKEYRLTDTQYEITSKIVLKRNWLATPQSFGT